MRGPFHYALAVLAGGLLLAGLLVVLVLGQHDDTMGTWGALLVVGGLGLWGVTPGSMRARPLLVLGLATAVVVGGWALARFGGDDGPEPTVRAMDPAQVGTGVPSAEALAQGVTMLKASIERIERIRDYTYEFAKRERAKSLLGRVRLTDELMEIKIRQSPFSVYARYVRPEEKKGTEAIYVAGSNDGKLLAHSTRPPVSLMGTVRLDPTAKLAMIDQRYPITKAGLRGTALEALRIAENDAAQLKHCDVRLLEKQMVAGRPCYGFEVDNPSADGGYEIAFFRILFDEEWRVPVFTERWHYLDVDGERRRLLVEQYTTTNLRIDAGLTDKDFDPENPDYGY